MIYSCGNKEEKSTVSSVFLNSLGYLPDMPKQASITKNCTEFTVKSTTDQSVEHTGKVGSPVHQDDTEQDVWITDFSEVTTPGKYYIETNGGVQSVEFNIDNEVYNSTFYTSMRAFYLWRCGTAVEGTHNGTHFLYKAGHLEDGYLDYLGKPDERKDGTGGWYDAGYYGKYTVNAGVTLGLMFNAWKHFHNRIEKIALDIPETAPGFPDYLEEIKWETDWLLKMQYTDGSGKVSHKLTRKTFSGFIMPYEDK